MLIISQNEAQLNKSKSSSTIREGDIIDCHLFNSLPSPVTARMLGGDELWIETLDIQTGLMRLDVCGQIDVRSFSEVVDLIDIDGNIYDPEDFWIK